MIQKDFYEVANDWHNVFLTGIWWSWKSYAVEQWKKENKHLKIVTVAPTGIAAINVWGSTIHSAFKLSFGTKFYWISKQNIKWNDFNVLIIDEISMVWVWIMEQIDKTLRAKREPDKPFGWMQVILVWDMAQLPPIIMDQKERQDIIKEYGWVEFNNSTAYKEWNFKEINLTENKRSHDDNLNNALNKIREDKFNINDFQLGWYSTHFSNRAIHLMPYNAQVDRFNYDQMVKLKGRQQKYIASTTGNFNVKNVLSPIELSLKEEATVMITKNMENWLVNWDMWRVTWLWTDHVRFYSFRKDKTYTIVPTTWEDKRYDAMWNETVAGTFTQIPMRLWWAITIHKSQWLSLDKVIFHYNKNMDLPSIYVWLSRATTYDWLYINTWT